jgi:hypothetical protein
VLGRSLDELPPQTRKLLADLVEIVNRQCEAKQCLRNDIRLSRKEIRDLTGWGDTQLRLHLDRLVQMEYLLTAREGNGGGYRYELLYDGDAAQTLHLSGLLDPGGLKYPGGPQDPNTLQPQEAPQTTAPADNPALDTGTTTAKSRGDDAKSRGDEANSRDGQAEVAGRLRADCAQFAAGLHTLKKPAKPDGARDGEDPTPETDETHIMPPENKTASYPSASYPHAPAHSKTAIPLAARGH